MFRVERYPVCVFPVFAGVFFLFAEWSTRRRCFAPLPFAVVGGTRVAKEGEVLTLATAEAAQSFLHSLRAFLANATGALVHVNGHRITLPSSETPPRSMPSFPCPTAPIGRRLHAEHR